MLVIVTPGQDTALTIRNTVLGGRAAGVATAAGVGAGQACWTVAASIGLAALLVASEPVFVAISWPAFRISSTSAARRWHGRFVPASGL